MIKNKLDDSKSWQLETDVVTDIMLPISSNQILMELNAISVIRNNSYTSLIFANLIQIDSHLFHEAGILYSASTGMNVSFKDYNGLGPYIATCMTEFFNSIKIMRWRKIFIKANEHQWIVYPVQRYYEN